MSVHASPSTLVPCSTRPVKPPNNPADSTSMFLPNVHIFKRMFYDVFMIATSNAKWNPRIEFHVDSLNWLQHNWFGMFHTVVKLWYVSQRCEAVACFTHLWNITLSCEAVLCFTQLWSCKFSRSLSVCNLYHFIFNFYMWYFKSYEVLVFICKSCLKLHEMWLSGADRSWRNNSSLYCLPNDKLCNILLPVLFFVIVW